MSSPIPNTLTAISYEEQYYKEHVASGVDYLVHGFWQKSYAAMVTDSTFQTSYEKPFALDAGCACGTTIKGFKDLAIFNGVVGVDLSEYMVRKGREHFGFGEHELVIGSIAEIPIESNSVSLLHSSQVLEHIPDAIIDDVLDEFVRVLRPGGRTFLCMPALRDGEKKSMYMGDPTHVNIQPVLYWTEKFHCRGLLFDLEAYNRYVRSRLGPNAQASTSFYEKYDRWNVWTLIRS